MSTTQEIIAKQSSSSLLGMIGAFGGTWLAGSGTTVTPPEGRTIFAIVSTGTTAKLGAVTGNIDSLSNKTISVMQTVYGNFTSVTSGADATDTFICYYR